MHSISNDDSTKGRLLKAAIRVFADKGFEAATVREICQRAGANVAAVNYHFGDKETLYFQVVRTIFDESKKTRTPYLPSDSPPEQRLEIFIRSQFEEILPSAYPDIDPEECMAMGTIFMLEMARPTGALDSIVEDYIKPDSDELNDILAEMLGPDVSPETVGMCTASVISQVLHFYYSNQIIRRLSPDKGAFIQEPGFIDYATKHVLAFSLGGIEHFSKLSKGESS